LKIAASRAKIVGPVTPTSKLHDAQPLVPYTEGFRHALRAVGVDVAALERMLAAVVNTETAGFWSDELGLLAVQRGAAWVAESTENPRIGLKLGEFMPKGSEGVVEYLVGSAATLRDALLTLSQFAPLLFDFLRWELAEEGRSVWLRLVPLAGVAPDPVIVDYRLVRMCKAIADLLGEPALLPYEVQLGYPRTKSLAPYREAFGRAALCFGKCSALRYDVTVLDRALPGHDPVLHRILRDHAGHLLDALASPRSLLGKLEGILLIGLQQGRGMGLRELARSVHMSERTLRRRLSAEGTSYTDLLNRVRAPLAKLYLDAGLSTATVAERLGFESASALRRAYRRWYGRPITQHARPSLAPATDTSRAG
jgi:AraC-like DNA-binding protein